MFLILNSVIIISLSMYRVLGQSKYDTFKEKPEKCYGTFELTKRHCCIFPPFFDQVSARACGALLYHISTDNRLNITNVRRDMFKVKDYWQCILTTYKMLDEDDKLINDKYYNHLDKWVALNPAFSHVITKAKMFCLNIYRYYMPLRINDFFEFQNCIRNYVNVDCPVTIQSKECLEWKEFYEECREFYI